MEHFLHNLPNIIMTLFMLAFAAIFYFIPTFISFARENPHRYVVFWLNLFLGWSGIVWVGLLVWAIVVRVEGEGERSSPDPLQPTRRGEKPSLPRIRSVRGATRCCKRVAREKQIDCEALRRDPVVPRRSIVIYQFWNNGDVRKSCCCAC